MPQPRRKKSPAKPSGPTPSFDAVERSIEAAMPRDRAALRKQLRSARRRAKEGKPFDRSLTRVGEDATKSAELRKTRRENVPTVFYDEELPVCQRREEIKAAIRDHQVVVVCGETGSGKSTQLPKICLELGRGVDGLIGHTQPRRIAARSIAARVADELQRPLGRDVGFKVRFTDTTSNATYVKLMTDGILLAETQGDRNLAAYDTIIVDEAHERSLNVDFLLGYLKRLLPKRRDLKVIITSATIDAERFAEFFADTRRTGSQPVPADGSPDELADGPPSNSAAGPGDDVEQRTGREPVLPPVDVPILQVSGRTYPVETRYRPPVDEESEATDKDVMRAMCEAVQEVAAEGNGDVLVFQPTERDIREAADVLRGLDLPGDTSGRKTHVLPLYGRLSVKEQNRVFEPHGHRRIVIATNVAESSVTVPGIRYVVDTGTARTSRYAPRSKVQRLPIEPVSKASANQRTGRCGRVGPGICVRLYSEEDFESREDYTSPEITRTNLAAVVLRTLSLGLGRLDEFPFIDPPKPAAVTDGYKTLYELGALDEQDRLTEIGRRLAKLPVDPRIGRMILAGEDEGCLPEVLVVAAALEVQDPRDRPLEKQQQADEAHAQFTVPGSDFLGYLEMWRFYHGLREKLSWSKVKKACHQNFLSYVRTREWCDVHRQLRETVEGLGIKVGGLRWKWERATGKKDEDAGLDSRSADLAAQIHRSLLTGLLSNVALREEKFEYNGAGSVKFHLWPGSTLFDARPKWIVSAELVETTRRYARTCAGIDPGWIEPLAEHLLKRTYSDPHWDAEDCAAKATERVSLFGLPIVAGRLVQYGRVDAVEARRMFVQHGLVEGDYAARGAFVEHNAKLTAELEAEQAKSRSTAFLLGEEARFDFFDARLPPDVWDGPRFEKWRKQAEQDDPRVLFLSRTDLVEGTGQTIDDAAFPDVLVVGRTRLPLSYHLEPGSEEDGVTVTVPAEGLTQLPPSRLGWLVPGLLEEKITGLVKSLPKDKRRVFVPAPDTAKAIAATLSFGEGDVLERVAGELTRLGGFRLSRNDFDVERLPRHLRMNVRVVDSNGEVLATGRDVEALQRELGAQAAAGLAEVADEQWNRSGLRDWPGDLPERIDVRNGGLVLAGHPAVVDEGTVVGLKLCDTPAAAAEANRRGIRRLFTLLAARPIDAAMRHLGDAARFTTYTPAMRDLVADRAFFGADESIPRTESDFRTRVDKANKTLAAAATEVGKVVGPIFTLRTSVRQALQQQGPEAWRPAFADMRAQLDEMTAEGFLLSVPWPWLAQFPRYLQAVQARLEKLKSGGLDRDRRAMQDLAPYVQRHRTADRDPSRVRNRAAFVSFRWMVEEYRVSLFAQRLGTAVKVSANRLDEQWARVVG